MTLADRFNKYGVSHTTGKSGVELEVENPSEAFLAPDGTVTDQGLNNLLDSFSECNAHCDENPHNRNAGLVVFVEHNNETVWFNQNECCWLNF